VLFADTGVDSDTLVKLVPAGVETDTILRSARSAHTLYFRITAAGRVRLQHADDAAERILVNGRSAAIVPAPVAHDATGSAVPVSMTTSGRTLRLAVTPSPTTTYPIVVDPTVEDTKVLLNGNWIFETNNATAFNVKSLPFEELEMSDPGLGSAASGQFADLNYLTQKWSHIYKFHLWYDNTETAGNGALQDQMALRNSKELEWVQGLSINTGEKPAEICEIPPAYACSSPAIDGENKNNRALYEQQVVKTPAGGSTGTARLELADVYISQELYPTSSLDKTDPTLSGKPNAGYPGTWINTGAGSGTHGVFGLNAYDPGIGIYHQAFRLIEKPGWEEFKWSTSEAINGCKGVQCNECYEFECPSTKVKSAPLSIEGASLPEGEWPLETRVEDYAGLGNDSTEIVKIDNASPTGLAIVGLPPGGQINEGARQVTVRATDGTGTTPSSGVASLVLYANGLEVGKVLPCAPGPCAAAGELTLQHLPVGKSTLTLVATDRAGNVASTEQTVYVRHATPTAVGPVTVNPINGAATITSSDVNVPLANGGALTLTRTYNSRQLTAGSEGSVGPQWTLGLSGSEQLNVTASGATLVGAAGGATRFTKTGSSWEAPKGDQNLSLSEVKEGATVREYLLKNATGTSTIHFKQPTGSESTAPWMPTISEGRTATSTYTYTYTTETVEGKPVIKPLEELAPVPSGVSCVTLEKGCRALKFVYGTSTKATGENESEWNEYTGRLSEVTYVAYNPTTKGMATVGIAKYLYDAHGRLRAEWNPEISPALKTKFGYDSEGHLTAITPPGQEPWLIHYGTTAADSTAGRVLSVARPEASIAFGSGKGSVNEAAPTLSTTTPVVGTTMSVATNGTWSNSPLNYTYQWDDCNAEGKACAAIPGAVNQSYTPHASDAGYKLVAVVTAENAVGAVTAPTGATSALAMTAPTYSLQFGKEGEGENHFKGVGGTAIDASGNVWSTDPGNFRVEEFKSGGAYVGSYGVKGEGEGTVQFREPTAIAINQTTEDVYVVDRVNDRIEELGPKGEYLRVFGKKGNGPGQLESPAGITIDSGGDEWITDAGNSRIEEFTPEGAFITAVGVKGSGEVQFTEPKGIVFNGGRLYVVDSGNNRIEVLSTSGGFLSQFGHAGSGNGEFKEANGIAVDPISGAIVVVDSGNSRVELFNKEGTYLTKAGTKGTGNGSFNSPTGASVNSAGTIYVADSGNSRVEALAATYSIANPPPTPPAKEPNAISTIEYGVPVSGGDAPYPLGASETAKWGQTDNPTEGAAVFPPDEPMGWPAKDYRRATISYLDGNGRVVNTALPSGGIATTEYNELNDVVRTLSADNRATAIAAGTKSAEVAASLESKSTYNTTGTPGTQLETTIGPEHKVKLSSGSEVLARAETKYAYNEGAPKEGGPYNEPTKTESFASYSGKTADTRESTTTYGKEAASWRLGKPQTITSEPKTQHVAHEAFYNSSGGVTESRTPAAANGKFKFEGSFGATGTGHGDFTKGKAISFDAAHGTILLADSGNNRIDEFNAVTGAYVSEWGTSAEGKLSKPFAVAPLNTYNRFVADEALPTYRIADFLSASPFEYSGQWQVGAASKPLAMAVGVNSSKYQTYVALTNDEIKHYETSGGEFFEEPTEAASFGKKGTGNGEFNKPAALAFNTKTGFVYVADTTNSRVEYFSRTGKYEGQFGSAGSTEGKFNKPEGIAVAPSGNVFVADTENNRIEEFTSTGTFIQSFGGAGPEKLVLPIGVTVGEVETPRGKEERIYALNEFGATISMWGLASPDDAQTIYYQSGTFTKHPTCGGHPEWAGLVCQAQPAMQPLPHVSGMPELPVKTYSYNLYGGVESIVETFGATTRTTKHTFDAAGRVVTSEIVSSTGTALPTVTNTYNTTTGSVEVQTATKTGSPTETVTTVEDALGRLVSYTDADKNVTTYKYDIGGRVTEVNDGKADGKGIETFVYSETSGLPTELTTTACSGCNFTATYDAEGHQITEGLPNGMTATYIYNAAGTATSVVYKKTTHCTEEHEKCVWFKDVLVPSIHGQWLTQESTFSKQQYAYDELGRLTQVQSTPTGKGCTTRAYGYDEEGNRLSLTSYPPNAKAECSTEGGVAETHTYDSANRLTDTGVTYDGMGDTTALPAADAEKVEMTNTYYADGQLATATQSTEALGYSLDPDLRVREVVASGPHSSEVTSHYGGNGTTVAWTSNAAGEQSQNIIGLNGRLVAIQNNGAAPELQIVNLHGDIVATAYLSETAEALATSADTTEYGVPTTAGPAKYSWLGAISLPTAELPSSPIQMGVRTYIPQLGRFLQPDAVAGGSANAYSYTFDDPVNSSDPSGQYAITEHQEAWVSEQIGGEAQSKAAEIVREEEEAAARAEAERLAQEAAMQASAAGPQWESEWEEWEEWWEEEGWEFEYVSNQHGAQSGAEPFSTQSAALLGESSTEGGEGQLAFGAIPLCTGTAVGPCAELEHFLSGYHGRGLRSACAVALSWAAIQGGCGDDLIQRVREDTQETQTEYVSRPRPYEEDKWCACGGRSGGGRFGWEEEPAEFEGDV